MWSYLWTRCMLYRILLVIFFENTSLAIVLWAFVERFRWIFGGVWDRVFVIFKAMLMIDFATILDWTLKCRNEIKAWFSEHYPCYGTFLVFLRLVSVFRKDFHTTIKATKLSLTTPSAEKACTLIRIARLTLTVVEMFAKVAKLATKLIAARLLAVNTHVLVLAFGAH